MRHIDVTPTEHGELATILATVTGNSFGDQLVELRRLVTNGRYTSYETIKTTIRHEGDHMSQNEIIEWGQNETRLQ